MEEISILLIIVLFFLINRVIKKIERVERKIDDILTQSKTALKQEDAIQPSPLAEQLPEVEPIEDTPTPPSEEEASSDETKEKHEENILSEELLKPVVEDAKQPTITSETTAPSPARKASFMERNPDLEKFIGENLLSKVGIVIFVIGMGFLVKLGIDNNIITESIRVIIGVVIGGGMIGLAHYLRNSFRGFSSILIGGALAVLYFTIALAFHEYKLISQLAAFIIMVAITGFGVLLSIAYDRKVLAVLAIIGGFGTPFFVSTGSGNFIVLLTYILILDIGMLVLVYIKKWNIINYLAYGFTYMLFVGVYIDKFLGNEATTRWPLLLFLSSFYLIFFLMTIIYNIKNSRKFKYSEIAMLLSNSGAYFGLGLSLIHSYKSGIYDGIFTVLIAIFNFIFAFTLYKNKTIDKNLLYLLIGLVLTFVSLVAPIQLEGNYITLFWAIEALLLLWLSQKSGIKLMKSTALLITILMLISLFIDWEQNYRLQHGQMILTLFTNKVFITSIFVAGSLLGISRLLQHDEIIQIKKWDLSWKRLHMKVAFAIVLYLGILLELNYQLIRFEFFHTYRSILLGIYNYTFIISLLIANRLKPSVFLNKVGFWLSCIAILSYLTVYLNSTLSSISFYALENMIATGFYWHYVLLILFLVILIHLYHYIHQQYTFRSKKGAVSLWILVGIGVFLCTLEVQHIAVLYQFESGKYSFESYEIISRSVYPAVWALSALTSMILGMKFRLKTLRIASLVLFTITIIKLFLYDLAGNTTGKIVSFILLGVILLLISFLYQKLKFIIQDDDENKN